MGEGVPSTIRVLSSRATHRYALALYAPMSAHIEPIGLPVGYKEDETLLLRTLGGIDLFHLHWPELLFGPNPDDHARLIDRLNERAIPIVWTQHNLLPHVSHRDWPSIYQLWADSASAVIHHSQWGMKRATGFRAYRPDAKHRVIRHGHWGELRQMEEVPSREELARPYRMDPGRTHLGMLGAPRASKDVQLAVNGFLASERDDIDLTIFSLPEGVTVPKHSHVCGRTYKNVGRTRYNHRLAFIDVLLFPLRADDSLLTTGVAADAIAVGKPVIVSEWPYLAEVFGDAAIVFGQDDTGLGSCLAELDLATLDERSDAVRSLQDAFSWDRLAVATLELFEELLAG